MRRILLLSAAALLAACSAQAPDGAPASPPADAPAPMQPAAAEPAAPNDFESDLRLVGTEPFWGVRMAETQMTLTRPDHPDVTIARPEPEVENGQAVWIGEGFTVRLSASGPCSDGMSDREYPFTALVEVGAEVLKGCGARADAVFPPA